MVEVICVGSNTVDVFVDTVKKELRKHKDHIDACYAIGSKQLINSLVTTTGGGGTNSAVSFSRLGFKTGYLGIVGDDMHGEHILDMLKKEKIRFLGTTKKGSSGYSVILTGLSKDRAILAYKGVNNSLLYKDVKSLNSKWLYMSSLMGKSFDTAQRLAKECKKRGIFYAFNPSSYLAKQGIAKLKHILSGCFLLILNEEEAQLLCKKKCSPRSALKILNKYASLVAITRGKHGALATDGEFVYDLHATNDKVIETTGAGDAFATGTLAGLMMGKDFEMSLRIGYAQSTSVISYVGAKQGLLSRSAVLSRARKQKVKIAKRKISRR